MKKTPLLLTIAAIGIITLLQSAFIVNQTEQVLVLQFGKPIRTVQNPGLYFKTPFIQDLTRYDNRILEFNAQPEEINMVDEKRGIQERVVVDAFVKYVITNPLLFYQSVRNEQNLNEQLRSIVFSSVREILGKQGLRDLLSEQRVSIMRNIRNEVNRRLLRSARETVASGAVLGAGLNNAAIIKEAAERGFGIDVVDVRINRADLPVEISQSTFNRMRANFAEEAQKFRSQGQEEALKVTSSADRERSEIIAEANTKAQTIRGEGEGQATKIFADAFGQDTGFFEFYRSLEAYENSIGSDDTTLILSPDSDFLKHLEQ